MLGGLVSFLPSCWLKDQGRFWSELGKFPQVLCRGGKQELVLCSTWSAQSQPTELEDALEMGKQHFNPFAISAGLLEGGRTVKRSYPIAKSRATSTRMPAMSFADSIVA